MATNNPSGFKAIGPILSANEYSKRTNAAIYPGDMVHMDPVGGKIAVATAGSTNLVGVSLDYKAATATSVVVADDPDQNYYVQLKGTTATAQTDVGRNVDLLATAGNATHFRSAQRAGSGAVTLATAQLRILALHPVDGATASGRVRVVINEHHYAKKTGGVASA
jgi:hypothetical protein